MKFLYEGVDITKYVYINRCEHETYAGGRADSLIVRFSDSQSLWNRWEPKSGDKIRYKGEAADTGDMYITGIVPTNGLMTIYATSMPPTGIIAKNRVWEDITLLELCEDVANLHGLKLKIYDVTDRAYRHIEQTSQSDFDFLCMRCLLEGCAVIIYDGTLVVYDEQKRDTTAATATVKIGEDGRFEFSDRSAFAYSSAEVRFGALCGIYYDEAINTGRVLYPTVKTACNDSAEALRFARGILRNANKNTYTGSFRRKITEGLAAGSVINLEVQKASRWNSKVFITQTRTDYVKGETKVFFRRVLEDY